MKHVLKQLSAALCIVILICSFFCAYASSSPEPTLMPTMIPEPSDGQVYQYLLYEYDNQGYIRRMKGILDEKKYYMSNSQDVNRKSDFFDNDTLLALEDCCQRNNLPFSKNGVIQVTYDAIMSGNIVSRDESPVSVPPMDYEPIHPYASGLNVTQIQQKLTDLHYDQLDGPYMLKPGVYDEQMLKIVRKYAEWKHYEMNGDSLSSDLQFMILNDDEPYVPEPEETPEPDLETFFLMPVPLFGLMVPRYAQWLACLVLVGLIVVLIVVFFVPDGKKSELQNINSRDSEVDFDIEYQGNHNVYQCSIGPALQIGRNVGRFPLNHSDREISRDHCEIYRTGAALMIKDHSTYGTKINGLTCHNQEQLLHSGDKLTIGAHTITITFRGAQ